MIRPGTVASSRRGPAFTGWGKAAVVGAGLALLTAGRTGPEAGLTAAVVAAVVVACLVDGAFALVGFRAPVVGIEVPAKVQVGREAAARIRFDGNDDLLATIPGYASVQPVAVDQDGVATIRAPMSRRAVHDEFVLQVLRPGPLGLVLATQRTVLTLPTQLVVLPPGGPATVPSARGGDADPSTEPSAPRGPGSGVIHHLREHHAGDGLRSVSWRASARRGDLVVAERPSRAAARIHVVVDAGPGWPDEAVIGRALTVLDALLARGDEVVVTARTSLGVRARPPRLPYFGHRLDLLPSEVETVVLRSRRDAEVLLGRVVGGPVADVVGPAYILSPTGDRWVDGCGA